MKMASQKIKISRFRVEDHLKSDEAIREFLIAAMEESTPEYFLSALSKAIKARGIAVVAKRSGLTHQRLRKILDPGSKPNFATICKLVGALGAKFTVTAG
jgi:probable addiction module antidote protein